MQWKIYCTAWHEWIGRWKSGIWSDSAVDLNVQKWGKKEHVMLEWRCKIDIRWEKQIIGIESETSNEEVWMEVKEVKEEV